MINEGRDLDPGIYFTTASQGRRLGSGGEDL